VNFAYGFPCPQCGTDDNCSDCANRRNCREHARVLIGYRAHLVFLLCRSCGADWWADTREKYVAGEARKSA
jgi:hypothetical protein